jgi:hypothetical protein
MLRQCGHRGRPWKKARLPGTRRSRLAK